MALDVDTIATDADLVNEIQSATKLAGLTRDTGGSAKAARQQALDDILVHLSRRTPPITETSLSIPAELKRCVVYGALERLYRHEMNEPGDVNGVQQKIYARRYSDEVSAIMPTIAGGARGTAFSIPISRR